MKPSHQQKVGPKGIKKKPAIKQLNVIQTTASLEEAIPSFL